MGAKAGSGGVESTNRAIEKLANQQVTRNDEIWSMTEPERMKYRSASDELSGIRGTLSNTATNGPTPYSPFYVPDAGKAPANNLASAKLAGLPTGPTELAKLGAPASTDLSKMPGAYTLTDDMKAKLSLAGDPTQIGSKVRTAYNTLGTMDLAEQAEQQKAALSNSMARRGLTNSTIADSDNVSLQLWRNQAAARLAGEGELAALEAERAARGEVRDAAAGLYGAERTEAEDLYQRYMSGEALTAADRARAEAYATARDTQAQGLRDEEMRRTQAQQGLDIAGQESKEQSFYKQAAFDQGIRQENLQNYWDILNWLSADTARLAGVGGVAANPNGSAQAMAGYQAANQGYQNQVNQQAQLWASILGTGGKLAGLMLA